MNDSPENPSIPTTCVCPTPDEWEGLLGPDSIMQSFDGRLSAHVQHCPHCLAYLEKRKAQPGFSLMSLACAIPPVGEALLPVNLSGIVVPVGYKAVGQPVYGGRGLVFKALHLASGRLVAIKMSKFRQDGNDAEREALVREAQAVSALSHPNIVQTYQVLAEGDSPAIVMEWVEGGTLMDVLKNDRPSIAEIVSLMKHLADAVGHAHQHLVLHRDIKPSNILMAGGNFNQPKLSDFGLAKLGQSGEGWSTATEFVGTPLYMAPESFRKETGTVGPAVDIYSLGAVLYRLLSGKVPFEGANPIELGMRVVQEEVTPIRQLQRAVPKDLETICLKCLRKEPEERYPDAAALKADLVRFEEGKPVRASREGTLTRWRRWARRDPRAARQAAAFGIFLIGVIIALAVLLERSRKSDAIAQQKLVEANELIGLASPIFKSVLKSYRLKKDEMEKIVKFANLQQNKDYEPKDLKARLKHYFLPLELADSLIKIPGYESMAMAQTNIARLKIKQFIEDHGSQAARMTYAENPKTGFRQTVLETALIDYSYACSQQYNAYQEKPTLGIGVKIPLEDPDQTLLKAAVDSAERVRKLNPRLAEPKGQLADYYMAFGENAMADGQREKAVESFKTALSYSEGLRDDYIGNRDRWISTLWHRRNMALALVEPPVELSRYLEAIQPMQALLHDERVLQLENRADIQVCIWFELRWKYMVLAGCGQFQAALDALDTLVKQFPVIESSTTDGDSATYQLHLIQLDRLAIYRLLQKPQIQVDDAEEQLLDEYQRVANANIRAALLGYFYCFRPNVQKRDYNEAKRQFDKCNLNLHDLNFLKVATNIMLGHEPVHPEFEDPAVYGSRRCLGSVAPMHQIIFEAERLAQIGQTEAAAARLKSIDAWLQHDMVVPLVLRVRVNEIREKLAANVPNK